jgi:hypothetical protein
MMMAPYQSHHQAREETLGRKKGQDAVADEKIRQIQEEFWIDHIVNFVDCVFCFERDVVGFVSVMVIVINDGHRAFRTKRKEAKRIQILS